MKKSYDIKNLNLTVKIFLMINLSMKEITKRFIKEYSNLYENAYVHLMFIKHVFGISQNELSYLTDTNKSTLFRNLNILIKMNLIEKKNSSKGNENELYLTEAGEKIICKIDEWITQDENKLQFTDDEKSIIDNRILKILKKFLVL